VGRSPGRRTSTVGSPAARAVLGAGALLDTLAQPWAGLSVLPLAGPADGAPHPPPEPWVVENVLAVARATYRVVLVDLPATEGPSVRTALSQADALIAVGRCETAGVRGLQVALEAWTAAGHDPDAAGAVVTGVRPQAPLAPARSAPPSETASGPSSPPRPPSLPPPPRTASCCSTVTICRPSRPWALLLVSSGHEFLLVLVLAGQRP
jgi:hypothetical protein